MIRKFLSLLTEYWKGIATIITIVGAIGTIAIKADRNKQKELTRDYEIMAIKDAVDELKDSTFIFYNRFAKELTSVREAQTTVNKRFDILDKSYTQHLQRQGVESNKWDEVVQYLKDIKEEVKKKDYGILSPVSN